jgi:hypothetical protein
LRCSCGRGVTLLFSSRADGLSTDHGTQASTRLSSALTYYSDSQSGPEWKARQSNSARWTSRRPKSFLRFGLPVFQSVTGETRVTPRRIAYLRGDSRETRGDRHIRKDDLCLPCHLYVSPVNPGVLLGVTPVSLVSCPENRVSPEIGNLRDLRDRESRAHLGAIGQWRIISRVPTDFDGHECALRHYRSAICRNCLEPP